jgi:hypothetical protein
LAGRIWNWRFFGQIYAFLRILGPAATPPLSIKGRGRQGSEPAAC